MDIEKLKAEMPKIAEELGRLMVKDGLTAFTDLGLTFEQAMPSVAITYHTKDGDSLKVSLSIEDPDADDED